MITALQRKGKHEPANLYTAQLYLKSGWYTARMHGYSLGLYGSILVNSWGRDIDIIAIPYTARCDWYRLAQDLMIEWGSIIDREKLEVYNSITGDRSLAFQTKERHLIDLKILNYNDAYKDPNTWSTLF